MTRGRGSPPNGSRGGGVPPARRGAWGGVFDVPAQCPRPEATRRVVRVPGAESATPQHSRRLHWGVADSAPGTHTLPHSPTRIPRSSLSTFQRSGDRPDLACVVVAQVVAVRRGVGVLLAGAGGIVTHRPEG